MHKPAPADHDILPVIAARWSSRALDPGAPVAEAELMRLFEAARWAPSSGNSQPWAYVYGIAGTGAFAVIRDCLSRGNVPWAGKAGALAVACAQMQRDSGEAMRHAHHDLGLSVAMLLLQAAAMDLVAHPMAGFDAARAKEALAVPDPWQPVTAIAIGRPASLDGLPEDLRARELAPRVRKPLSAFVFEGRWPAAG
jgi:nitroreductase